MLQFCFKNDASVICDTAQDFCWSWWIVTSDYIRVKHTRLQSCYPLNICRGCTAYMKYRGPWLGCIRLSSDGFQLWLVRPTQQDRRVSASSTSLRGISQLNWGSSHVKTYGYETLRKLTHVSNRAVDRILLSSSPTFGGYHVSFSEL